MEADILLPLFVQPVLELCLSIAVPDLAAEDAIARPGFPCPLTERRLVVRHGRGPSHGGRSD